MSDEVTMARTGLLDALEALESHLDALVIVGAQAVYLHTGATQIALAEFTTDGDVAIDPDLLSSEPLIEEAMRRSRGIEATLVAKLHKIHDRIDTPPRSDNKDAHDVYRLLRAVETPVFVEAIGRLLSEALSGEVTRDALGQLRELFAQGARARGSLMAGAAEELVGDPIAVSESVALLADDLLEALGS